jgi:hypothetical protein
LLTKLDSLVSNEDNLVEWLGLFSYLNDNSNIKYDKELLISKIEKQGYKSNDCVGNDFVKNDKHICAKWLIGQALDNLHSGRNIHSICQIFADDYKVKFLKH